VVSSSKDCHRISAESFSTSQLLQGLGGILLVSPWYKQSVGGVAEVAELLLRLLNEVRISTSLLVTHERHGARDLTPDFQNPNVWYLEIPSYAFANLTCRTIASTLLGGIRAFRKIRQFVKSRNIRGIVLIYPIETAWLFWLLRLFSGARVILSCHGNDISKFHDLLPLRRWVLRGLLKSADAIIACADHLAIQIQQLIPSRKLPITVISNCVDVNYFSLPPPHFMRGTKSRTIVHISNFAPKKRTSDIIEAFALADVPKDTKLIMVGAGAEFETTVRKTQELGLTQRVEFVGRQTDVRPFLWRADLFVLASDDEGAPLVLLEAMACGIPWVSTPWGVAAALPNGECGLVVPPKQSHKLGVAMAELIHDPERCRLMGLRGRKKAETEYTLQQYRDAHLRLLADLLATGSMARH
jgi:glycosyltransferase involved in cell wall biosynthesis